MKIYIRPKLLAGFIVSIFISCLLFIISIVFIWELGDTIEWGSRVRQIMFNLEQANSITSQIESNSQDKTPQENIDLNPSLIESLKANIEVTLEMSAGFPFEPQLTGLLNQVDSLKSIAVQLNSNEPDDLESNLSGVRNYTKLITIALNEAKIDADTAVKERSIATSNGLKWLVTIFFILMTFVLVLTVAIMIIVNNTIRARVNAEKQIKLTENQLRNSNQELESFTSYVSHDLRAPIRSIIGYTETLRKSAGNNLSSESSRLLEIIASNAHGLELLVQDLLEMSRVGRGKITRTTVNLSQFVKPIWEEAMAQAGNPPIKIHWNSLGSANIDVTLYRQVWLNLFNNAIKFSIKKEDPIVEVGYLYRVDTKYFYVKDNGAGFDMKYASKLFMPFERLHRQTDFQGTGLGLSLVKKIVERHGGEIYAESSVNTGATFYFSIPD